jgi:hypothetical protein
MGETQRVIRKRTVVHTNSAYKKDASGAEHQPFQTLLMMAVIVATASFIAQRTLLRWKYDLRQQQLQELFNVTIVHGFLAQKDPDLLSRVLNDDLWRACDILTLERDIRFWYYPENKPNNIFEELIQKTYQDTPYWQHAVAYEYWCNIMERPYQEWPWHTDRDEDVMDREVKLVFPLMGAVYYGSNHSYEGGDFHMVNAIPYKKDTSGKPRHPKDDCGSVFCIGNPHLLKSKDEAMYVETSFDMLLFANVTHFHKVTPLVSGMRYALAMNANHWLPYKVEQAPSNEGMVEMASQLLESKKAVSKLDQYTTSTS